MARTNVKGTQVLDGTVGRADLNITVSGNALITKLIANSGVAITNYTGVDSGTGDVTVAADLAFLDTKYPSIITSRTQNYVLAAPASGNGTATFRALVAGDIPVIAISGVTGLQTALDTKLSGAGTTNYLAKYTGSGTLGVSSIFENTQGVGIGSNAPGINTLKVSKDISTSGLGGGIAIGIRSDGEVASDVTGTAYYFRSDSHTATAVTSVLHYAAYQSVFGGTVGTQTGFLADNFSGASNNIGFRGNLVAATNNWNLYMSGTANNYLAGSLGIGTTTPSTRLSLGTFWNSSSETVGINLREGSNVGELPAYGIGFGPASSEGYVTYRSGTGNSSVFGHKFFVNNVEVMRVRGDGNFGIGISTPIYKLDVSGNARLTSNLIITGTIANSSAIAYFDNNNIITDQSFGLLIDAGTSANDYILKLRNSSATEMLIVNGTGSLGIGPAGTLISNSAVSLAKSFTNTISYGIYNYSQITSSNTGTTYYYRSLSNTQANNFTIGSIMHYSAAQGSIGANSSITNQYGFLVESTMTGATNNYGFHSSLPSGNWNLYMSGTGSNFLNGRLGIGSTVLVDRNLQLILPITGGTTAYGMLSNGQVQSGVTANAYQYFSQANAAADVTLSTFAHYTAVQGAISGSINAQIGFYVPALTGASNNYAFRGTVTNATGAWNLYMDGTANNYIAGKLGIGTTSVLDRNVALALPLSSTTPYNFINYSTVQSNATSAFMNYSQANVAAGVSVGSLYHFVASQASLSGTVGNQFGFLASSALTGGTNNFGFYGDIPAGTGLWNLYMNGHANNYMGGSLGIASTSLSNVSLRVSKNITGGGTSIGVWSDGQVQSDVSTAYYFRSGANTQNTTFTVADLYHYGVVQGTIGANSTVTRQAGLYIGNLSGGITNYAIRTQVSAAANSWNIFADGTANNHIAGKLGIGTTTLTQANINITLPLTGNETYYGISNSGIVQNDVTSALYYRTSAGTASGSALTNLVHFGAYKGTFSGSVNNQFGFYVDGSITGATTANYAYFSAIMSGAGNWGFYSGGSANNYMNGNLWIGTNAGSYKLDVNGNARFTQDVQFENNAICDTAPTDASHLTNKAYVDSLSSIKRGEPVKTIALSNIALSGTQTVNGVALVAGDLILVAGQTTTANNGVYMVASGAWSRSSNNDSETEIKGAYHLITGGTYINQRYINTNNSSITVGTTAITYGVDFGAETDPIWTAFKTAQDITPTRIGQWNTAYTTISGLINTNNLNEGSNNLYFTTTRVLATALTGYSVGSNAALAATDTVLQSFQKLQGQVNNRLQLGGNTTGAAIVIGTNDNFDFSLERNTVTHLTLQNGVSKFFFDIDVVGKVKVNGDAGLDHQFMKFNGSDNEWAYLNTGELQDKNDIVMLNTYSSERGFQMYSDSTNAYANALVFSNDHTGIALGLYGYSANSDTGALNEFGLQLDVDGNLYHRKLDGTRSRIATVDMVSGGSVNWNGGTVSNDILMPIDKGIYWDSSQTGISYNLIPGYSPPLRILTINSQDSMDIEAAATLVIKSNKMIIEKSGTVGVELDLSAANSFPVGQYLRFQVTTSGGTKKLVLVSD